MPELPEVEIIRQYLDEQLPGRTIACVDILLPRQLKYPEPEAFQSLVAGKRMKGMRRRGKIDEPVERYSVMRSLRAIDRADVVLMMINAFEGITEQDKKIAGYAHESGKGVVIVVNKWDIYPDKDDKSTLRFTDELRDKLGFLQYAPVLYTSALTGSARRARDGSRALRGRAAGHAHQDECPQRAHPRCRLGQPAADAPRPPAQDPLHDADGHLPAEVHHLRQ